MRALLVLCLVASIAHADPPGETASEPTTSSYRGQVVAVDAIAAAGFLILRNTDDPDPTLAKLDVAMYLLAAPFVHGKHDQGKRMLGSALLRLGLPLAVGGLGYALDDCSRCEAGKSNFAYGLLAGALGAMIIDATLIAKPVPVQPRGVVPLVGATHGGATFGLAGWY